MAHVITQSCCSDASCVPVCPVDCIHPTPGEPDYGRAEMLYIDPQTCIDCGACVDVCPVEAIVADFDLDADQERFGELNAAYYASGRPEPAPDSTPATVVERMDSNALLRVAIVGSGPSACYAAEELCAQLGAGVEVSIFEKLPTPFGLVRFGVAPDHQSTKAVAKAFAQTVGRRNVDLYLNVEAGRDLTHEELLEHHDAVIYAVGAPKDRSLNIPGEDLAGSHSATEFVAWYNGHPEYADARFDLSGERAVVIGNGNVALDVARVLVTDPADLARTDIAEHALEALSHSRIREVVVVGRRGPAQAAFTTPELLGLGTVPGLAVTAENAALGDRVHDDPIVAMKTSLIDEYAMRSKESAQRRINLQFHRSPVEILGTDKVEGVRFVRNGLSAGSDSALVAEPTGDFDQLECGLVLRSVGYRSVGVAGLPSAGPGSTIENAGGRVLDPATGRVVPRVYTAGWLKRGPSGVIGTNKSCSAETVRHLVADFRSGLLAAPRRGRSDLADLVQRRQPDWLGYANWKAIDAHERAAGRAAGRPRAKLVDIDAMVTIARHATNPVCAEPERERQLTQII
ncbi:FAD-dependent oxidoreductase [Aldersonia kunmingensis]|uniref:FAD-dependent oxidoreductase n=1 Tax=Aldersonia kunmingensis TaxID=408066 RepID=UPI0008329118|nr:FAD-dependent oxidoreductase [Aldersonia kunmingensis]